MMNLLAKRRKLSKTPMYGIDLDFGDVPYWNNVTVATKTDLYMLSVITMYNNIDGLHGLHSTPHYGFNWKMKEFKQTGYDATVSELSNNLIGMNAVDMLDKTRITSDVYVNVLSYLMFFEEERDGCGENERAC